MPPPKAIHLQMKFTHEELTCISNMNAVICYGMIRSRHFKIINRYPGVNTWSNNKNKN